ncbi:MAG: transcription-repair coupling factor [Methylococcaceae bacterium]|nr:transcription-repair coupling factor [Methylococcaceae bacterium]MCI0668417.1 transcription-repair coupling factor [Methylococcaceae bacterium]MCI0734215.1 transcription-repair coupling factor [Methylococcaceae bacterium]
MTIFPANPASIYPFHPSVPNDRDKQTIWTGLYGCGDSLALASLAAESNRFILLITKDPQTALRVEHEIRFFLPEKFSVLHLPDWETLPYDVFSPLPEITSQRLETLAGLPTTKHGILILSAATLMHRIAPREHILANSFAWKIGQSLPLEQIRQQLAGVGYQSTSQVYQHGEFAVRGSILDLFPMGTKLPFRIELFDDEIDSIRTFDTDTQRSLEKFDEIRLFPAREIPFDEHSIKRFRQQFRSEFPQASQRTPIYQDVSNGIAPGGIEYYMPLFVDKTESIFSYCPRNTILVLFESAMEAARSFHAETLCRYEQRRHDINRPILNPEVLFLSPREMDETIARMPRIQLQAAPDPSDNINAIVNFDTQPLADISLKPQNKRPTEVLEAFIDQFRGRVLFVAETAGHREALMDMLRKQGIFPEAVSDWKDFLASRAALCLVVAPMDQGLLMQAAGIAIITESQLTGQRAQQRRRRRRSSGQELENIIANLTELSPGTPVVHQDHGVGRYYGLKKLEFSGVETEFLILEYANHDKLYVPVASLHLIGRYTGAGAETAPLHKLGGEQWKKVKKRAAARIRDVAAELLDIHARRAAKKGFAHKITDIEYEDFALGFPFEETPDQETAIEQVLQDMTAGQSMDRVICGDVGFGKTEVSMRAAFVSVQNAKQVAVLVPTTLLAQQHFRNFRDRFAGCAVRIEVLSRFIPKKQQDGIIRDVANGGVDILIGTHKLLQKGIDYKNLGLVVIDEEHRFGVRHKEHFKKLRGEVDILTLTATPIPRTLNMAMSGLRDLSIIASPPPNRHSINTFVSEWIDALIQEACLREIRRGGQIFFLHNNVKTIERASRELKKLLPEARLEIAHGQMPERALERVMLDFYHQRFNLLLCTTIIESGIDIPSANTIVINRADKLGLAQLHQLRGRVGRSHHRAYAYLIVPPRNLMTPDAIKRIEAIEASDSLGAGFMLSSHDLEIRGAGELLGEEQSGQIQEIGFSLYTEMLERAVASLKSGKEPELDTTRPAGPEIELNFSSLIPDDYLPDVHTRLVLYKRIANAESTEQIKDLKVEMIDRFGLLPEATRNLFEVTEIKLKAAEIGILRIEASATGGRIVFSENPNIDPMAVIELVQNQAHRYKMEGPEKLRFIEKLESSGEKIQFVNGLLERLAEKSSAIA